MSWKCLTYFCAFAHLIIHFCSSERLSAWIWEDLGSAEQMCSLKPLPSRRRTNERSSLFSIRCPWCLSLPDGQADEILSRSWIFLLLRFHSIGKHVRESFWSRILESIGLFLWKREKLGFGESGSRCEFFLQIMDSQTNEQRIEAIRTEFHQDANNEDINRDQATDLRKETSECVQMSWFFHLNCSTTLASISARRMTSLGGKYGPYTVDYDRDTSVKRIKPLRNNMVSNTAVWIIIHGWFTIQYRAFSWKVQCPS